MTIILRFLKLLSSQIFQFFNYFLSFQILGLRKGGHGINTYICLVEESRRHKTKQDEHWSAREEAKRQCVETLLRLRRTKIYVCVWGGVMIVTVSFLEVSNQFVTFQIRLFVLFGHISDTFIFCVHLQCSCFQCIMRLSTVYCLSLKI